MSFFILLFSKSKPPPKTTSFSEYRRYYHKRQSRRPSVDDIFQNNAYPRMLSLAEKTAVAVSLGLEINYFKGDHVSLEYYFFSHSVIFPKKMFIFFLHIDVGVGTTVK